MITSKRLPGEPDWEELITAYRLYRLLRSVVAKELEEEKLTPEEQKLAELEEYNPRDFQSGRKGAKSPL